MRSEAESVRGGRHFVGKRCAWSETASVQITVTRNDREWSGGGGKGFDSLVSRMI